MHKAAVIGPDDMHLTLSVSVKASCTGQFCVASHGIIIR